MSNFITNLFNKVGKIEKTLLADAPKIENNVKVAIENQLKALGVAMVADANNPDSKDKKTTFAETTLAAFASSIATSVAKEPIVITPDQTASIAAIFVNGLDSVENFGGEKLETI
jgi:hypothetical protein